MAIELTPQEKSRVWWHGAFKGARSGFWLGLGVAFLAAIALAAVSFAFPPMGAIFGTYLTTPGIALAFCPIPLMIFNTALTVAANAFSGGQSAVGDYQQKIDHAANEARISHLQNRELMLEQVVGNDLASRNAQAIIERGPRNTQSFADAEAARALTEAQASKVIH